MKFIGYKCEFNGKINEIHILINEKSNREIPRFFEISRDTSRSKIEPGSQDPGILGIKPYSEPILSDSNLVRDESIDHGIC